ncbi:MAG TPA: YihY/virulence factor BrkB family protein [Candidatus Acidoferrales bacterium]|nr:YihY/virulence factor BrkB family protein [Candidatus Acidoferrales bacterium]
MVPACLIQAQAIAYAMFLTFFPVLLLSLGLLRLSGWSADPERELPRGLQFLLPEGSTRLVTEFLARLSGSPWKLILLGLLGTLLVGTQVMACYIDGFSIAWRDSARPSYWTRYRRALAMLCLTIVPWLATGILTVFGRELRRRAAAALGGGMVVRVAWTALYEAVALATGLLALWVMYNIARPGRRWRWPIPGALLATVLWWILTAGFSLYVRNMHYNLIYGSMATVIGLLVWMYFVALVVMIGAAFNAELTAGRELRDPPRRVREPARSTVAAGDG